MGTKTPSCCLNKAHTPADFKAVPVRAVHCLGHVQLCWFVLEIWATAHVTPRELQSRKSGLQLSKEKERNVLSCGTI